MSVFISWSNRLLALLGSSSAQFAYADALATRDAHGAAFPLFASAARSGLTPAQFRLGRCYLLGLGVPPSTSEGLRWLTRAAEAGDPTAQTQLAALAMQGVSDRASDGLFGQADPGSAQPDFERAEHWCRLAVATGSIEAKALLATILTSGPPERRNPAAGEALYRETAQAGGARGRIGLAMILLQDGTQASARQAYDLLQAAAADGIAIAHHLSGTLEESGAAGPIDLPAAAASYKAAAEMGHAPAQVRYGFVLLNGRGTQRDPFTAETWLRRAALAGEPEAAAVLGYLHAQGDEPNHAEAAIWLQRAAEAGHPGAARTIGRMHMLGTGGPRDVQEAATWLLLAARAGDQQARSDLAQLALTGQLAEAHLATVVNWLQPLAAAGDASAQFRLGLCLAQGVGIEQDVIAAFDWCRRAAESLPEARTWCDRVLAEAGEPEMVGR